MPRLLGLLCLLAAASCAGGAPSALRGEAAAACAAEGVRIDRAFERAAFAACTVSGPGEAVLDIRPEAGTVNDSAWYAFRLRVESPRTLHLLLRYEGGRHRYWPKLSRDGARWAPLEPERVRVAPDQRSARLTLSAAKGTLFIAAQPLEDGAQVVAAVRKPLLRAGFRERVLGRSAEGRALTVFARAAPAGAPLVVLLARQHPPETTGAEAFEAFVGRITARDAAAAAFRARTAVLVAPLVNPDGFARGHWRGNAAGVDLNRDWGLFATPEIAALGREIEALSTRHPLRVLIDFHSTQRDVVYAAPLGAEPCGAADAALQRFTAQLGAAAPPLSRSHTPDGATAKAWSLRRFGAAGFTYEVGDDADLAEARAKAEILAQAVMDALQRGKDAC